MKSAHPLEAVARLPAVGDNVAIAVARLEPGTAIAFAGQTFPISMTILEGHRFAVKPISKGEPLLSWNMPFGFATRAIEPGEYVCNEKILWALRQRHVDFSLSSAANFEDYYVPFQLDESQFRPGRQVERYSAPGIFNGFLRPGARGVGTRNFIAILGTSSRTAGYARALAERFRDVSSRFQNIDGVVAIAHTEAGTDTRPNNAELVLRTLAGFMTHPNIGAILAVDTGFEFLNNGRLRDYLIEHEYPLGLVFHRFLTLSGGFIPSLRAGEAIVRSWLETVNGCSRSAQPLEHLRIGLQCGGSDGFSGVSGNPLVGWVTKELVRHGGSANLAETDELIGAEPYILANIKDLPTARRFLKTIESFQERAGWHGHTGEGNPSGGNNYRGLYNIAVKSIGAARKKDPDVCVDYVIDYATPMRAAGFYFMDSPGNDLESVAGQVGAGCNLILFTTGNGSITNFPFVPTIKVMTNTPRFNLLHHEMDVNAGRYLDGTSMDLLGRETFELTLRIASGDRSAGEKAGHSQVQLWREWRQRDKSRLTELLHRPKPNGEPVSLTPGTKKTEVSLVTSAPVRRKIGLIVPTSLCAGQVGKMIAEKLNGQLVKPGTPLTQYVALAHTEGCGSSSGESEEISLRTMTSYLCHPLVGRALLLEHGCEKTHNDALKEFCDHHAIDYSRFGFASIQLDGGLENVTQKVYDWFNGQKTADTVQGAGGGKLSLGLAAEPGTSDSLCRDLAEVARQVVVPGGTIVVPHGSWLLQSAAFKELLASGGALQPTLAYGEQVRKPGFHIMETPTDHTVEILTGLGATGVEVMLASVIKTVWQCHPMVPLIQLGSKSFSDGLDLVVKEEVDNSRELLDLVQRVRMADYIPRLMKAGDTDFQMTRGLLGVSL